MFDFTGNRHFRLVQDEEAFARAKEFIGQELADGSLPITIDREFQGLEKLPEAMQYMSSNLASGKIVITI